MCKFREAAVGVGALQQDGPDCNRLAMPRACTFMNMIIISSAIKKDAFLWTSRADAYILCLVTGRVVCHKALVQGMFGRAADLRLRAKAAH